MAPAAILSPRSLLKLACRAGDLLRPEDFGPRGSALETWVLSWNAEWVEEKSLSKPGVMERRTRKRPSRNWIAAQEGTSQQTGNWTRGEVEIMNQSKE